MPKQITFSDKTEANEYVKAMKSRGWDVLLVHDTVNNKWTAHVSLVKEGKPISESKVPSSISDILAKGEEEVGAETTWAKRQFKRLKKGGKKTGIEMVREADIAVKEAASGRSVTPVLQHTSRRLDVVGGMKKAIPVPGGDGHGYLARIGEMKAVEVAELPGRGRGSMSSMEKPSIAQVSRASIAATSSGIAAGAPRGARFRFDVTAMRMKLPRTRKREEENITTEEKGGS